MAGFDGRELLFQTLDQRVMAVSCTAKGDSFAAGKPRVWTETCLRGAGGGISYDLALDGKRLAAILADDANGEKVPTHLTFLPHFIRRAAAEGAGGEITMGALELSIGYEIFVPRVPGRPAYAKCSSLRSCTGPSAFIART